MSVVGVRYRPVPVLPGRVPDLRPNGSPFLSFRTAGQSYGMRGKLHSQCGGHLEPELIFSVPQKQLRFSNSMVSNKYYFEHVVAIDS